MWEGLLLTVIVVVLVKWIIKDNLLRSKWKNKPPGPPGIPIFGNLRQMGKGGQPLKNIQEWKDEYGDVVRINLGQYRVVILSGYETIKEAFSTVEFSGRQLLKPFHEIADGKKRGLTLSEGQASIEQRRFAIRNLKDFGFGRKSMENSFHDDITELIDYFKELEGRAFVPHRKFTTAVLKSLWKIIAGESLTFGDPKFQTVQDSLHSVISSTSIAGPAYFLPWLVALRPNATGWNNFKNSVQKAKDFLLKYIKQHQKTFDRDNIRDYIDIYLKEISDTQNPDSSFYKNTGEEHLLLSVLNLFSGGSETSTNTLVWALLYLIKYPHVQDKLFQEICNVCGTTRLPSLDDKDKCPYAWAVMEEVFRLAPVVPLGVFHSLMADVTFKGYFIPKDTLVLGNIFGVHYDKKVWGQDVEIFRPERFLIENDDVTLRKNLNAGPCIAFSVGKRACIGEVLARNNFFLYLTSLVQKFEITSEDDSLNIEATPGLVRCPKEFTVTLKERELK